MQKKIRYYSVKGQKAYWQPTPKMREFGFKQTCLGDAGAEAIGKAEKLNEEWSAFRESLKAYQSLDKALAPKYAPEPDLTEKGYVYFLHVGEALKIGFSKKPLHRLSHMTTSLSGKVDRVVIVPGSRADEKKAHRFLTDHRIKGEWFFASEVVVRYASIAWLTGTIPETKVGHLRSGRLESLQENYCL